MEQAALLVLLLTANGSPIVARALLGRRLMAPLDGGLRLRDARRLLGPSKTVAGAATAILASTALAPLLGYSWWIGALVGICAMLGDMLSSFIKRRLGLPAGARAIGLDQVPESLLPLLVCAALLGLSWVQVLGLTLAFTLADLVISRLMFHLGLPHHPH